MAAIDDRLQIRGRLVVTRLAPDQEAQPPVLAQHGAGSREAVSHRDRVAS